MSTESKAVGLLMAKASKDDLDMALDLAALMDNLGRGYYPAEKLADGEEAPTFFDAEDRDHLTHLHDLLLAIEARGSLHRVAMGMGVLIDPKNAIVDPDLDHLALHARLKEGLEASRMLDLLERMANQPGGVLLHDGSETGRTGFGLRPGSINRTLREALRQALESEAQG
jgi:hypothetical protein